MLLFVYIYIYKYKYLLYIFGLGFGANQLLMNKLFYLYEYSNTVKQKAKLEQFDEIKDKNKS